VQPNEPSHLDVSRSSSSILWALMDPCYNELMAIGYTVSIITYVELLLEAVALHCEGVTLGMKGADGALEGLIVTLEYFKVVLKCVALCGQDVALLFEGSDELVAAVVAVRPSVISDTLVSGEVFAKVFNHLVSGLALVSLALELRLQHGELLLELLNLGLERLLLW
jgi:hypothetical protein